MALFAVYAIAVLVFLAIDAIGLKFMIYPLFSRHVGDLLRSDMQLGVAAGFYLFYVAGLMYFAILPAVRAESPTLALTNGALLGLIAYGTYEATNMATLRGWVWQMLVTDMLWGISLTAVTAAAGYAAGRWLL
jgi:uncharacterized membrane protein